MAGAVQKLAGEASWKLTQLERSACFHTEAELVTLYKSKLLGYLEYQTPAIYHATDTTLAKLDKIQKRLLRIVSCTEREALLH